MLTKEELYVKLVIYSLGRSREFILSHYDEKAIKIFAKTELENHLMIGFAFEALDPSCLSFKVTDELLDVVNDLIETANNIKTADDLYQFAIKDIPIWINKFENVLKSNH